MRLLTLFLSLLCVNVFAELPPNLQENKDSKESIKVFEAWKAKADRGDALYQLLVGDSLAVGCGVKQNFVESFKYYEKSADQGLLMAQSKLAECYESGIGVEKDLVKAHAYYSLCLLTCDAKGLQRFMADIKRIEQLMSYIEIQAAYRLKEMLQGEMVRTSKELAVTLKAEIEAKKQADKK